MYFCFVLFFVDTGSPRDGYFLSLRIPVSICLLNTLIVDTLLGVRIEETVITVKL